MTLCQTDKLPDRARSACRDTSEPTLMTATVRSLLSETEAAVETDDHNQLFARQAGSCLLAPAIGDRVLVCDDGDEAFILAVLERCQAHVAELSVPDARGLRLKTDGVMELSAGSIRLSAKRFGLVAETIVHSAESLTVHVARLVENAIDKYAHARSQTTRVETRNTSVDKADTLNAGSLVQKVDGVALQNSQIAMINAEQDVRLDAERVSVG